MSNQLCNYKHTNLLPLRLYKLLLHTFIFDFRLYDGIECNLFAVLIPYVSASDLKFFVIVSFFNLLNRLDPVEQIFYY